MKQSRFTKQNSFRSKIAKKVDLASLKSELDKFDIGKLENTPADLRKLSDAVKN